MQTNVDNYSKVNSLPSVRLFTWFFVVPGVLLMLNAGYGLWGCPREDVEGRPPRHPNPRLMRSMRRTPR
jgi:hypothetical protein